MSGSDAGAVSAGRFLPEAPDLYLGRAVRLLPVLGGVSLPSGRASVGPVAHTGTPGWVAYKSTATDEKDAPGGNRARPVIGRAEFLQLTPSTTNSVQHHLS